MNNKSPCFRLGVDRMEQLITDVPVPPAYSGQRRREEAPDETPWGLGLVGACRTAKWLTNGPWMPSIHRPTPLILSFANTTQSEDGRKRHRLAKLSQAWHQGPPAASWPLERRGICRSFPWSSDSPMSPSSAHHGAQGSESTRRSTSVPCASAKYLVASTLIA
jgi:hypothetical protein